MRALIPALLLPLLVVACDGKDNSDSTPTGTWTPEGDSDTDTDTDTDTDSDADTDSDTDADTDTDAEAVPLDLTVIWDVSSVLVRILKNGEQVGTYDFGMAETGAGAEDGWFGEDCAFGDKKKKKKIYELCHEDVSSTFTLDTVSELEDLDPGKTTMFRGNDQFNLTYLVKDASGSCIIAGDDPSYYSSFCDFVAK